MTAGLLYLDSSALLKLIVMERETRELLSFLAAYPDRVSSVLAKVEVYRALLRAGAGGAERMRAHEVLERLSLIRIDDEILDAASALEPSRLRSLDAIHLATALSLGRDLEALVCYDRRLAVAAGRLDLRVTAPR